MSHYTTGLADNISLDVRRGKLFKKGVGFFFFKWPWIKLNSYVRTGYAVTAEHIIQKTMTEYHLIKTKDGQWLSANQQEPSPIMKKTEGKWQPQTDDAFTLAIKKAIDDYENK